MTIVKVTTLGLSIQIEFESGRIMSRDCKSIEEFHTAHATVIEICKHLGVEVKDYR